MRSLIFLLICALTTTVFSANYYVSNAGNDSNNGASPSTAWKTLANVNSQSFSPGDSILFKRGDAWNERLTITTSGTSGNPITYSAYGTGDKPVFNGIGEVAGWATAGNWTDMGNNVWRINTWEGIYGRLWINGAEKERSLYSTEGVGITAARPWQKINGRLYAYSTSNPATAFSSMRMAMGSQSFLVATDRNHININNIEIRGWFSIEMNGCSNWLIEHCDITQSALRGFRIRRNGEVSTSNGIIRHCTFDTEFNFYNVRLREPGGDWNYTYVDYAIQMSQGGVIDWDIYNNYFKGWGYTTFWAEWHTNTAHVTHGLKFHDNILDGSGMNYGRPFAFHFYTAQVSEQSPIEVYNNYIYGYAVQSQIGVPFIKIYNNVFNGFRGTDDAGYTSANALSFSGYSGRPALKNKIYNNVFANCGWAGQYWSLSGDRDPVEDLELVNNIFYENGSTNQNRQLHIDNFASNTPPINPKTDNNIFYKAGVTNVIYALGSNMTVAQFNALDGDNGRNLNPKNNIYADPLFVDPANGDFRLQANSPAIGAGLAPISSTDAAGNAWNNPPSIGPFEYIAPTRVSESILSQSSPAFTFSTTPGTIVIEPGLSRRASIEVALYDGRGRRVSLLRGSGGKSLRLETKAFAPGVYTMQILIDGRSYTRRIAVGGQRQLRM